MTFHFLLDHKYTYMNRDARLMLLCRLALSSSDIVWGVGW